jgi:CheY-like chemotaxis protein
MIVGVTGNVLPADIAAFMRAGANKVLGKPLNLNDLDDVLNGTFCYQ